jgi:hypothetical protein
VKFRSSEKTQFRSSEIRSSDRLPLQPLKLDRYGVDLDIVIIWKM